MNLRKISAGLILGLTLCAVPVQAATGQIKGTSVNMRKDASTSSTVVASLNNPTKVSILSEAIGTDGKKWYKVSYTSGAVSAQGFIRSDLITIVDDTAAGSTTTTTTTPATGTVGEGDIIEITSSRVNVRADASTSSGVVGGLAQGSKLKVVGVKTGSDGKVWAKVSYTISNKTTTGYIRSDLVKVTSSANPAPAPAPTPDTTTPAGTAPTITQIKENGHLGTDNESKFASEHVQVKGSVANIREHAGTEHKIVGKATHDQVMQVTWKKINPGDNRQWIKIDLNSGGKVISGYIRADLLQLTTAAVTGTASSVNTDTTQTGNQTTAGTGTAYTVTASAAKVRSSASTSSSQVTSVLKGATVYVETSTKGTDGMTWYKVNGTANGKTYNGYIRSDLMTQGQALAQSKTMTPTLDVINIRSQSSATSSLVAKITKGTKVTVSSETTGSDGKKWYGISCTANGKSVKGFIRADLLK